MSFDLLRSSRSSLFVISWQKWKFSNFRLYSAEARQWETLPEERAFCLERKSAASPCTYYKDCWSTNQHRNMALQSRSVLFCTCTIFGKLERFPPNSFHAYLLNASNNLGLNLWNKSIAVLRRVRVAAPFPVIKYLTRSRSWQKPFILAHLSEVGVQYGWQCVAAGEAYKDGGPAVFQKLGWSKKQGRTKTGAQLSVFFLLFFSKILAYGMMPPLPGWVVPTQ